MPEGADDLTVQRHSRAYILTLMGSILFADKSGDAVYVEDVSEIQDRLEARSSYYSCGRGSILLFADHIRRPRDPPQEDPEAEDEDDILGTQHQRGVDPLACRWLRVHLSCAHTASGLPYYRDAFDHQREDQMIWQPYTEAVMDRLPEICRSDMHIWRSRAPLICFDVVEFHLPDRVLRQFG
ncbi:serine/threonine-protein phosphatase 7 long form homolog [Chenopodium quinoa]|uniref:serine/threonine-protein phosphatase 7 long form homolog n=1 Tax=Chenopodium quinoa TaxID=63459 RepID=UPI000B77AA91|nr:serine/threonine-protein phosphatase 7 long form homolog [Chenopodium quinoa]